ncbi:T9SS type A sorting domain-containing protein [Polaribacter sp. BAL334]|uniref:T9SS type A sorting domain-containing protein n=1 Tax=Polaribacter sp. BAL334 TaxID=1708178 RepID=UPI0018D23D34|nr:T9SS type A sorting domain-containing protein [Polaribacter sp. BAL334]MBG7612983.1 T9SS type A sorting domain-containing protein [Polaribacter sp. BAL334]
MNFGNWDFCSSLGVDDSKSNDNLGLYPNPTVDILLLGGKKVGIDIFSEIEIFDMTGKSLKTLKNHNSKNPINISELANGAYIIIAKNTDDKVFRNRFIKK